MIGGGSVLNPRNLERLVGAVRHYKPTFIIVHIRGNNLDRREDCTELCILKLVAFFTQIRQSFQIQKITVLKLIPCMVTRHVYPEEYNHRVIQTNILLKLHGVDANILY